MNPSLLVSVRSAVEAKALENVGCAIIDVKEPDQGALGMADPSTMAAIADVLPPATRMSVALGELVDFRQPFTLPQRVAYLKLGLANSPRNWRELWEQTRAEIDDANASRSGWVAVIYADYEMAGAPAPQLIVDAAAQTRCSVVLVDTFRKATGSSVFDFLSVSQLQGLRSQSHAGGMKFALAGQLRSHHSSCIREVAPDIVGIRGAACISGDRGATIDATAATGFLQAISAKPALPSG